MTNDLIDRFSKLSSSSSVVVGFSDCLNFNNYEITMTSLFTIYSIVSEFCCEIALADELITRFMEDDATCLLPA